MLFIEILGFIFLKNEGIIRIDLIGCCFEIKIEERKKTIQLLSIFFRRKIWPERCRWTGSACTVSCVLAGATQTRWPVTSVQRV